MDRVERGDWQTPPALASKVVEHIRRVAARTVIEPTCGDGAFLGAADEVFPRAELLGFEIDAGHVQRARIAAPRARVVEADFFATDWARVAADAAEPILVVGNPPWVTSSVLGAIGGANLPAKSNFKRLRGLEARTGAANFDVSEWMILRLLEALRGRDATLAMLCKTAVARRVIERAPDLAGELRRIDAMRWFDASVDAALFVVETRPRTRGWAVYESLDARAPSSRVANAPGGLVADARAHARTSHLDGRCDPEWRSGIKHDCAKVMELDERLANGFGEIVDIEAEVVFPLLKSSDVANGRAPRRAVIVPQRALADDTPLPPRARAYLARHRALFDARKSSVYEGRPPFAVFGVGDYSFAPWKVAVSGLYKRLAFTVVGPERGRPVMLDDTCYFLPFDDERPARRAARALQSPLARAWFDARVFWEDKRPIRKSILQRLDLERLISERGRDPRSDRTQPRAPR